MKRYRFLSFYLDTSRHIFNADAPIVLKEQWKKEQRSRLESKYGVDNFDVKFERWLFIPKPPLSVVGEHTHLLEDIERSYITGALYSAITGACCLGERIFNQIILRIRNDYRAHPQYKKVKRDTLQKWDIAINTLKQWDVIDANTEKKYRRLHRLRTDTVHFQVKDQDLELLAKEGIELINGIVFDLFNIGPEKIFVSWCEVPGEMYLRKEFEDVPFVREFYIPSAKLVGYRHTIANTPDLKMVVIDRNEYTNEEISDTEFVRLRKQYLER